MHIYLETNSIIKCLLVKSPKVLVVITLLISISVISCENCSGYADCEVWPDQGVWLSISGGGCSVHIMDGLFIVQCSAEESDTHPEYLIVSHVIQGIVRGHSLDVTDGYLGLTPNILYALWILLVQLEVSIRK